MTNFARAVEVMFDRGWTCHPLRNDANGFPKIPITPDWSNLPHDWDVIKGLVWTGAAGIGIVLGAASNNLAVLDVDDSELFSAYVASNLCPNWYRLVRTARKRGHVYMYELDGASPSTVRKVQFRGRIIQVELKAQGGQVCCPPSPGYELLYQEPPQPIDNIMAGFEFFMDCLEDFLPGQVVLVKNGESQPAGAGYPKPWSAQVPESERNKTAYMEAHTLREAGTPVEVALRLMQARFDQDYAKGGITWREIETTIRSAYRKGEVVPKGGYGGVALD